MDISRTQPSFQAKFIYSDALKQVADYAVEHNKFNKLNQARKNIDSAYLTTRLKLDISKNADNLPVASFTRYVPKKGALPPFESSDYIQAKTISYAASEKINPLKFVFEKIIKLSNNAPQNKMYKSVVKD